MLTQGQRTIGMDGPPATMTISESLGIEVEGAHFGNLSEVEQPSTDRLHKSFSAQPGFQTFWGNSKISCNHDFAQHVDAVREHVKHEVGRDLATWHRNR